MKYLLFSLFLFGCSNYPKTNIGMVHDYVINNAIKSCSSHEGLHYIVSMRTVLGKESKNYTKDYPCMDLYKFRCQDNTLIEFNSGVTHCFIDQMQLDESL